MTLGNILVVTDRTPALLEALVAVWEASVKATHLFLSPAEIAVIKGYVPQAIGQVEHLIVAEENKAPVAFMGVEGHKLEMLFVAPDERGKGIGKSLLTYGFEHYGINEVTVNEQNPQAIGFYQHMGFETDRRTDLDEQGMPYPLLYMKRKEF